MRTYASQKSEDGQALKKLDGLEIWLTRLMVKVDRFKAKLGLANKLARIAWVIIAKGEHYNATKAAAGRARA